MLSRFSAGDRKLVDDAIERAAAAVSVILSEDIEAAMNIYNRKAE